MKADRLQNNSITVSGHLEERRGYFHIALSWTDQSGNRGRKSVSTGLQIKGNKKRAEEVLRQVRQEQQALLSSISNSEGLLFADFMEQWLDVIRPDVKLTTFGGYQMNVQKAIGPYFRERGTLLRELTAEDINDFYDEQLKRIKSISVLKYHANISKALKYAVERNLVPYSIMGQVKRPKPERFVGKFLRQSEAIELFETVKGHRLELGVILGAFYGLRRSEIIGLRWESIDFEANAITIEHTVTEARVDGKKMLVAGDTTKSKSSFRSLPLVPGFRVKLLAIKEEQEKNRRLCGNSYNKAEARYIYTDALGNRIRPGYLTSAFPDFMVRNGFRRLRFHDLRHSCASLLLANGVPLKQIQEWLGHSDFAITANTYAHLEFNSKLTAAKAMTWIDKTALSSEIPTTQLMARPEENDLEPAVAQFLPDFLNSLIASGVSLDTMQAWIRQADFTSPKSYADSFRDFSQSSMATM